MSLIAGLDYDSEAVFGAVIDEDSGELVGTFHADLACGPGDSFERARRVRDLMPARGSWLDAGVVAIGIEATLSRQRASIAALSRVQGALLACLPRDVPVLKLAVNRKETGWKALTVGKTNAPKAAVKAWAIAHGAADGLAQDFYDAFAIAFATRSVHANRTTRGAR